MAIPGPKPEGDDEGSTETQPSSLRSDPVGPEGPYRIRAVAELTGVPEPTLRAWERRYGVPSPERTASGYRLYGASDLKQVRTMRRLCGEGMAAAEAARAVLAESASQKDSSPPRPGPGPEEKYSALVNASVQAVARMDQRDLEENVGRGMLLGSAVALFDHLLAPVLVRVGDLWHAGELSVAEEHFATQRIGLYVRDLTRIVVPDDAESTAIVASGADDDHEIGALGVALRLATWGMRPIYLGPRTPPSAIGTAVETLSPGMVALSLTIAPSRSRARELLDGYAAACESVPWVVGGAAVQSIGDMVTKAGGIPAADVTVLRRTARSVLEHRVRGGDARRRGTPKGKRA